MIIPPLPHQNTTLPRSGFCNFSVFSAPWAGNQGAIPWVVSLRLRLKHHTSIARPASSAPLSQIMTPWRGTTTETGANMDDVCLPVMGISAFDSVLLDADALIDPG